MTRRKTISLAYIIAAFLLAGIVSHFFIAPQILQYGNDFSFSADIISIDNFYDEENAVFAGADYSETSYTYDTVSVSKQSILIRHAFDVRTLAGDQIVFLERFYGVDKKSGEHIEGFGDKDRNGYLFAPNKLSEGQNFTYWHVNYDAPAYMVYDGQETIDGLRAYRYTADYSEQRIDQTEDLGFLPEVGITRGVELEPNLTAWFEPLTGRLIKYEDETTAYYYDLVSRERLNPWNQFSNRFSEESIADNVNRIFWQKSLYNVFHLFVPLFFAITIVFLGLGSGLRTSPVLVRLKTYVQQHHLAAFCIWLVGIIVLIGWALDWASIQGPIVDAATMNPLTAACFILTGAGLYMLEKRSGIGFVAGMSLIIIASLQLLSNFDILQLALDELMFREQVMNKGSSYSEFTAIGFTLIGFAFISFEIKRTRDLFVTEILGMILAFLASFTIIGYLLRPLGLLELQFFVGAAIHTASLMLIAGLSIVAFARSTSDAELKTKGSVLILLVLLILSLFTVTSAILVEQTATKSQEANFERETTRALSSITDRIGIYVNALKGAEALLSASDFVSRDEWKVYVDALEIQDNFPGIQGVGYAVFVEPEELDAHIEGIRNEGFPDFTVRPEGERSIYTSIIYLEPFDIRNQQAFGFDMYQEVNRRKAMSTARDMNEATMSGRITLVQEIDSDVQPGFLIYVPHYENGSPRDTVEERRENIAGYAYSPFRARNFVEGAIGVGGLEGISLRIYDGVLLDDDLLIYDDSSKGNGSEDSVFTKQQTVFLAGRAWTFVFESNRSYGGSIATSVLPIIILFIGVLLSVLITVIFYVTINARQRATKYAEKVTTDLQESNAKDEALLLSIGDILVAVDVDGRINFANRAFEEVVGKTFDEMQNTLLSELLPEVTAEGTAVDTSKRLMRNWESLTDKRRGTTFLMRPDGKIFPAATTIAPVLVEGNTAGAVIVMRDVTAEKAIDDAKTEFVSLASHQLRTPLTSINWYAELLLSNESAKYTPDQRKQLQEIVSSARRMSDLVESLLNVSRLELGTMEVNMQEVDLANVLRDVESEMEVELAKKSIRLIKSVDPNLSLIISDESLIRMILQNLLSNAIKYSKHKSTVEVDITGNNAHGWTVISVKDSGIGIPKEQQKRVFQKMFRADNVKVIDTTGTGLGLYIVKKIIERLGGKITFVSEEGVGTTFTVSLPSKQAQAIDASN